MAYILIASSSEIDVMAKQLCKHLNARSKACKINQYRDELRVGFPELENIEITLPRYALTFTPWKNWNGNKTPHWWSSHNKVKHQRDEHFKDTNLKNVLNAMAALFSVVLYYYRGTIEGKRIEPPPNLFTPPPQLARVCPTAGGKMALFFEEKH